MNKINVIGGGLAGVEAAWQAAEKGARVKLYEMRPVLQTPAHRTDLLAEIVCSNSLKSDEKARRRTFERRTPARKFARHGSRRSDESSGGAALASIGRNSGIHHRKIEAHSDGSRSFAKSQNDSGGGNSDQSRPDRYLGRADGGNHENDGRRSVIFYDAIARSSRRFDRYVDRLQAARYGKGGDDYINCPLTSEQYESFTTNSSTRNSVPLKAFRRNALVRSCLPIDEMARRGIDTLRFGPMKPKGLPLPATGREPYAAVQLRQENLMADAYSLVGFQIT
jgi:methylenetetrahydrofolate--tRNA-(uracil-5-)-methyltransferase